jgi:uncharacterized protein (DUF2132 family)
MSSNYTDAKYIEKGTPLFQGEVVGLFNRPRGNAVLNNKLFWVTRNSTYASTYGKVSLYIPVRRLKLLKLTYRTVSKLLKDPSVNSNLKQLLLWTWGNSNPNATFLNQFKSIVKNNKYNTFGGVWSIHRNSIETYNPNTGMIHMKPINKWPMFRNRSGELKRAGRFSRNTMNWNTYMKLKNQFNGSYDGLWSPHVRSPLHGIFRSEIVLFNARSVLQRFEYPNANLQKNSAAKYARLAAETNRGLARRSKPNTRINNVGNFFGNK